MANINQLPCDGDGICMLCKNKPPEEEKLTCKTCNTPWHNSCLAVRPETLMSTLQWECPDCAMTAGDGAVGIPASPAGKCGVAGSDDASGELIAAIRAIEADTSLTERQKARKRQELMSGTGKSSDHDERRRKEKGKEKVDDENEVLNVVGRGLNCSFCMQLPERPVTVSLFSFVFPAFCVSCCLFMMRLGRCSCSITSFDQALDVYACISASGNGKSCFGHFVLLFFEAHFCGLSDLFPSVLMVLTLKISMDFLQFVLLGHVFVSVCC
ncbi:RING-type E3 ubiquitin transferase [Sarracenia purpurea var. burkii]